MKEKILNINGQYVKFCVTTNSAVPKMFKNNGTLVVYYDDEKVINKNYANKYIYLGGEIIASGFGFSTISAKDKAEEIVEQWDNTIDHFNNAYSYTIDYIDNVTKNMLNSNSDISNTYINYNEDKRNTLDMLVNRYVPKYDKMEILSITNYAYYYDIDLADNKQLSTKDENIWKDNGNIICVKAENGDPLELPIGVKLAKVMSEVEIKMNDEEGQYISANYSYLDGKHLYEYNNIYNIDVPLKPIEKNVDYVKCSIDIDYHVQNNFTNAELADKTKNIQYFVKKGLQKIGTNIKITSNGTKKYKNYKFKDKSEELDESTIPSIENSILPNITFLPDFIIDGKDVLINYAYMDNTKQDYSTSIDIQAKGKRVILKDEMQLIIPKGCTRYYIAVPENYQITTIYHIDANNEKVNITGNFTSPFTNNADKYDVNVYPYIAYDKNNINININNDRYNNMKYKIYYLTYSNNSDEFIEDFEIILNIDKIQDVSPIIVSDLNDKDIYTETQWTALQNEDFKACNWMSQEDFINCANLLFRYCFTENKNDKVFSSPMTYFDELNKSIYLTDIKFRSSAENIYCIIPKVLFDNCSFYYYENGVELEINGNVINKFQMYDINYLQLVLYNPNGHDISIKLRPKYYIGQDPYIITNIMSVYNSNTFKDEKTFVPKYVKQVDIPENYSYLDIINNKFPEKYFPNKLTTDGKEFKNGEYLYLCIPKYINNFKLYGTSLKDIKHDRPDELIKTEEFEIDSSTKMIKELKAYYNEIELIVEKNTVSIYENEYTIYRSKNKLNLHSIYENTYIETLDGIIDTKSKELNNIVYCIRIDLY